MKSNTRRPILITGALGRVAQGIAGSIADRFPVVLTDLPSKSCAGKQLAEAGIRLSRKPDQYPKYVQSDLTDFSSVLDAIGGVGMVIHLAVVAQIHYQNRPEPAATEVDSYDAAAIRLNPIMTHHVLEASHRLGVTRVVQGSSLTVQLGDLERPDFCEDDSADPQSVYACSKLTCEHLGQYYTRKKGLPVFSLRIGQPYPVPTRPAEEWRSSKRARSIFITMSDLAQGIAAAVTTDAAPGVYNLVSDSDNPRVSLRRASEMGYTPLNKFTAEGIWSRDTPEAPWHLETPVL